MLRALKNKNFRIFFGGQIISISGSLMQLVALNWLAYALTHSAFLLGVVNFARHGPAFFLGLFTGPLLDRWDRRRVLFWTYLVTALLSLALALLIFSPYLTIGYVIFIATLQGCVNALDTPGRQSFIADLFEKKEELSNAIPLDSSVMNIARLVGPSLGGVLIAATNEGVCFLINAVCYLLAIFTLLFIKIPPKKNKKATQPLLQEIKEGILYTASNKAIWSLLLLVSLLSLVGIPFIVLMLPIYAKDIFHAGPQALGFLHTGWAIGAISGALYLASRKGTHGFKKKILSASLLFGLSLILFSQTKTLWLSLLVIPLSGFLRMIQMAGSNTLIQTVVSEEMRGRVMTFFAMTFIGVAPFGSLVAGSLASRFGAPATVLLGGVLCCLGALFFVFKLRTIKEPSAKKILEQTPPIDVV